MGRDKTIKLELHAPKAPELGIPEEYAGDPTLTMLYNVFTAINELKLFFLERYADKRDYFFIEDTVSKTDSKTYVITEKLGRISKSGFITNDGTDTIYISINEGDKISLKSGETFKWGENDVRVQIERLYITTDSSSSQSFRLLAI